MLDSSPVQVCSSSTSASGGSYETKFLLPDAVADQLLERVQLQLAADPHSDPTRGDGYQVSSLYLDTANLDTYHRRGSYRRRKFRLRRYGSDSQVFLERKSKSQGVVKKRRTTISAGELMMLHDPNPDPAWPGFWYRLRLETRRLFPVCNVSYERKARVAMTPEGPIRFTVDRQVRCCPAGGLAVPTVCDGQELLIGQSIVEMKFRFEMPVLFKNLVHEFALLPVRVSKFRLSVEACGLVALADSAPTEQAETPRGKPTLAACG